MAAVTICSDFGAQANKVCHYFHCFPIYLPWSDRTRCHDLIFECWVLSQFFPLSSFTFNKRFFSFSSLSAIKVVSSAYLRLLIFLPATLILAWNSSNPAFCVTYSAYKLNKQGDDIQPCRASFPILNHPAVPCMVLTSAYWPTYRFFRRQVRWSDTSIPLRIFHSWLWLTQSKALA